MMVSRNYIVCPPVSGSSEDHIILRVFRDDPEPGSDFDNLRDASDDAQEPRGLLLGDISPYLRIVRDLEVLLLL